MLGEPVPSLGWPGPRTRRGHRVAVGTGADHPPNGSDDDVYEVKVDADEIAVT